MLWYGYEEESDHVLMGIDPGVDHVIEESNHVTVIYATLES